MAHVSRRQFLATSALAGGAAFARPFSAALAAGPLARFGVQLYTVRSILPEKPLETLKALEAMGFQEAEVVRGGIDKIWPSLKQTKLKPVSIHMEAPLFLTAPPSELDAALEDVKSKGFEYAVLPYIPNDQRGGLEMMRGLAGKLNRAGEKCRSLGMKLCYHNHAFEFEPMEGTTPLDVLMDRTDKNLVALELDIFWAGVAGHNPSDLLKKYRGRVPLVHLKNKGKGVPVQFRESTVPRTAFMDVGSGVLDMPLILKTAAETGVRHYFVEQDTTPGDPLVSLKQSADYLKKLKY